MRQKRVWKRDSTGEQLGGGEVTENGYRKVRGNIGEKCDEEREGRAKIRTSK